MSLLNTVTGECEPFSEELLKRLDSMTKQQALEWVWMALDSTVAHRNHYEADMISKGIAPGLVHAWCIENNNIIRFKRLYEEIAAEG